VPKASTEGLAELRLTLSIGGITVAQEKGSFMVPPTHTNLSDELILGLVRQAALKLIPTLGVRDQNALRLELFRLATLRETAESKRKEDARLEAEAKRADED